jgi:hypothetical protein
MRIPMADEIEELTEAEIKALLIAIEIPKETITAELIAYYAGAFTDAQIAASDSLYIALRDQLTGTPDAAALANARAIANREAATLAKGLITSEINAIGEQIAYGLERGMNPREIAKHLDSVRGLDSNRAASLNKFRTFLDNIDPPLSQADWERRYEKEFNRLLKERKTTIARTEHRIATGEANAANAKAAGAKFKVWITAGDDRVSDACQANEAAGWIAFKDEFPGGVMQVPQHVNCRCTNSYRTQKPTKAAEARAETRAEGTEAAKEDI